MFGPLALLALFISGNFNFGWGYPSESLPTQIADIDEFNRIVGGSATNAPIPYQISMQYNKNGEWRHFCGGSIIAEDMVLTAAHCVHGQKPNRMSVLAGTFDFRQRDGSRHEIVGYKIHDNYQELVTSDIALVKINPPFEFNEKISKINVFGTKRVGNKEPVTLTGWGSISPWIYGPFPTNLQMLNYTTISNAECKQSFGRVTETEICAYQFFLKGACAGDSGGPLVNRDRNQQIGIVSYGTSICSAGLPDVFTRVSVFEDWIKETMASDTTDEKPSPNLTSFIIFGQEVSSSVPYIISIQYQIAHRQWSHVCGGSIISSKYVLTAAHCMVPYFDDPGIKKFRIVAGITNLQSRIGSRHKIISYTPHPKFEQHFMGYDIGVIKVHPRFKYNKKTIAKIRFDSSQRVLDNIPVILHGWGWTGYEYPERLRSANFTTVSEEVCKSVGIDDLASTDLCVVSLNHSLSYKGDSGGPLVNEQRNLQLGVCSYGIEWTPTTVNFSFPTIFTRVSEFSEWIKGEIKMNILYLLATTVTVLLFSGKSCRCVKSSKSNRVNQNINQKITRIIGGELATDPIPYQVSLQNFYTNFNQWRHICGGSIISKNHVLTAAHCTNGKPAEKLSVVVGTSNWKSGGFRYYVQSYVQHELYTSKGKETYNDVVVLKVSVPFEFNEKIAPISLADNFGRSMEINYPVTITGWGVTDMYSQILIPDNLMMLNYSTISNEDCIRRGFNVSPNEVCALHGRKKGSCLGDSGGPLVNRERNRLIGLVSYGSRICADNKPDVYVRVSKYIPWILKAIAIHIP
ncbi:transmembrane protease serine 9-like [Episyrphus balteatus]|uniref:transmembrane protease serine 9-like n=1 Tax=Episyrphus balteatus TaxID=286459 RepID=UPI002486443E|nr:transmembrane protease serine 9-like [Episyrphus balteatus]